MGGSIDRIQMRPPIDVTQEHQLRAAVLGRGVRLDETGPGHGLGLAIVADLAEATDGTIELGASPEGGLLVVIRWSINALTIGRKPDSAP